jgi:L-threonylcarbamoyladenylate synthase|tara:strand:+ start:577 stop:1176 length:600 start_codon:yes stop_codon:yes gene_type:complete
MEIALPTAENMEQVVVILKEGGTVAHATETCYGLACNLSDRKSVQNLFDVKERPVDMPVSALFESIEQAKIYTEWSDLADQLALEHLPGPLTIIVPLKRESGLFPAPQGGRTIGVRISPHPIARKLVQAFGAPISTTSANIHNQTASYSVAELEQQYRSMQKKPDLLLDSGALKKCLSSSVVSVVGGSVEILRAGPLQF